MNNPEVLVSGTWEPTGTRTEKYVLYLVWGEPERTKSLVISCQI